MTGALAAAAGAAAGGLKPLSVSTNPSSASGVWDSEFSIGITDLVTAVADGGLGPYSYSWTKRSGDDFTVFPNSSAQAVTFNFTGPAHKAAVYRVTVTDALNQVAFHDVNVTAN